MIFFASKHKQTIRDLTQRAETAETERQSLETRNGILETLVSRLFDERDLLHDHALDLQDRYHTVLQEVQAQEHSPQADEIARLSADLALATNDIKALTQERDRLSDDLATAYSDLALAYQTRDDAMLEIGTQKITYDAQLKDRDERIVELEAKLRKRQSRPKTEPPVSVAESEATA